VTAAAAAAIKFSFLLMQIDDAHNNETI